MKNVRSFVETKTITLSDKTPLGCVFECVLVWVSDTRHGKSNNCNLDGTEVKKADVVMAVESYMLFLTYVEVCYKTYI